MRRASRSGRYGRRLPGGARILPSLLCAAALVSGCGAHEGDGAGDGGLGGPGGFGGPSGSDAGLSGADCQIAPMRRWIDASMRDYYLFADRVPSVRLEDHDSDEATLDALRVVPPDRFSYIADEASYDALFEEGETFGFGWRLVRTDQDTFLFELVQPGSPFDAAGVLRGDRLIAIDGIALPEFVALPLGERERILGLPDTPVTVDFTIESPDRGRYVAPVTSATFTERTVLDVDVAEHGGARVGYLNLTGFIEPSESELDAAFTELAAAGVDELVLDLRFNLGGRVHIAAELAAAIAGELVTGETFAHFRYNERYAEFDQSLPFVAAFEPLNLSRVLVLASGDTCSASEMVINALEPFIDVVLIGGNTCGKPFGTVPNRRCGRVLNALEVRFENDAGVGGYVDGLSADCRVDDDPRAALGRPGDPLYDAAVAVVTQGGCPAIVAKRDGGRMPWKQPAFARPSLARGAVLE